MTEKRDLSPPPFDNPLRRAERLLQWAEPLLDEEERLRSRRDLAAFAAQAPPLQAELDRLRRRGEDAFLDEVPYWEGWYLSCREPLPVHANPFYLFDLSGLPREGDPCRLAARLALAGAAFCLDIDGGRLEADSFRGERLCMAAYEKLFRVSRGAFPFRDRLVRGERASLSGRSALVLVGGRPFLLELISPEGELRRLDETARLLRSLYERTEPDPLPLGLMTTVDRDEAHRFRSRLVALPSNERSLAEIEGSLFALRLDGPCGDSMEERACHFLFDEGKNGWYEKSFQIIVAADGAAGLNFEHSARDGTHMGRLVSELLRRASALSGGVSLPSGARPLSFVLDEGLRAELHRASRSARNLSEARRQRLYRFDLFGADRVKAGFLSPDAFVQLAFLAAQRRLWPRWRSLYESVQMRRFRKGRTEGTRPLTAEAALFVETLAGEEASRGHLRRLLLGAGDAHRRRIDLCMAGEGVEGHLGLLRRVWQERGADLAVEEPSLFQGPAWTKLTSNVFSSSTTEGKGLLLAGYGPVQIGGLGLRYLRCPDHFLFHVSSWAEQDQGEPFVEALDERLSLMGMLL